MEGPLVRPGPALVGQLYSRGRAVDPADRSSVVKRLDSLCMRVGQAAVHAEGSREHRAGPAFGRCAAAELKRVAAGAKRSREATARGHQHLGHHPFRRRVVAGPCGGASGPGQERLRPRHARPRVRSRGVLSAASGSRPGRGPQVAEALGADEDLSRQFANVAFVTSRQFRATAADSALWDVRSQWRLLRRRSNCFRTALSGTRTSATTARDSSMMRSSRLCQSKAPQPLTHHEHSANKQLGIPPHGSTVCRAEA